MKYVYTCFLTALLIVSFGFSQNLVDNPEFDNGLEGWWVGTNAPGEAAGVVDDSGVLSGDNSLRIEISTPGDQSWHILAIGKVTLEQDVQYDLSFKAFADAEVSITANIAKASEPWTEYYSRTVTIGGDQETFGPFTFTHGVDEEVNDVKFFLGGTDAYEIYLDSVAVVEHVETRVEDAVEPVRDFTLAQNYPNPFNPSTVISFSLLNAADVSLEIFNANGQSVNTLVQSALTEGTYHYTWSATDDVGASVPVGVYFYRLYATDGQRSFEKSMKMLYLK